MNEVQFRGHLESKAKLAAKELGILSSLNKLVLLIGTLDSVL